MNASVAKSHWHWRDAFSDCWKPGVTTTFFLLALFVSPSILSIKLYNSKLFIDLCDFLLSV